MKHEIFTKWIHVPFGLYLDDIRDILHVAADEFDWDDYEGSLVGEGEEQLLEALIEVAECNIQLKIKFRDGRIKVNVQHTNQIDTCRNIMVLVCHYLTVRFNNW